MLRLVLVLGLFAVPPALAQTAPAPCSSPPSHQLDFWLGEWDLTWEGGSGTNSITRRLGDCVIQEEFAGDLPSGRFEGHSVSVYDGRRGEWRQTWVDSQGGYLLFTGGLDDDGIMRLYGEPRTLADGRVQHTRMSWVDVDDDSLDWHWERSFDDGQTWEMVWLIHYERR